MQNPYYIAIAVNPDTLEQFQHLITRIYGKMPPSVDFVAVSQQLQAAADALNGKKAG